MAELLKQPLIYIAGTVILYALTASLYRRWTIVPFNPLILAPLIIIAILKMTGISFDTYNEGGRFITFLLGPATVALGVPLYKKIPVIKSCWKQFLGAVVIGAVTGLISMVLLLKLFGASEITQLSLAAKSTTMPIALGITEKLGGIDRLEVLGVVFAGVFGGMAGPEVLRMFRVRHREAMGLGIGTASHAGGTARALQLGETEGSFSSAAIVLTGLVTALIAPFIVPLLVG